MSPMGKGLLATALTLPLVAFVAGVLASPDPVDPDRSRPVIIGQVNDDAPPAEGPRQDPPRDDRRGEPRNDAPRDPRGDDPGDSPGGDDVDDPPYTVVTPPPRDLDDDGDDGDDDDDDRSEGGEGSGDD